MNNLIKQNVYQHGEQYETIPENTNILIFHNRFNLTIKPSYIPSSVTHIIFGAFFNKQILINTFPKGVQFIQFGNQFDQAIIPLSIPDTVQQLTFGDCFNQTMTEGCLPSSIIKLVYGDCFNQELNCNSVPSSVKYLKLGSYNRQIKDLKKGCVTQDKIISYKVKGSLPSSIEQLSFGPTFNQNIPDEIISSCIKVILVPKTCTYNSSSIYFDKIKCF
ncbi:hypothetical protein DICPUDRAFT_35395 [Dictyostelium purpureum]|uniref:Uncharacterized protein n=1 Tax=Dictyostelium purpureum TaxID=5786 RepID=F0ZP91_DICPU|nr:uncharacterized protein DICPUDRAFT_35395 [Dictyostelium purpureum]EGC34224.1 hypothetical protein DICPUDRAFT_35395 [Dictyostelium purpureum]|eukprot:XP_003289234.1 hypothetical protein DICPUDRAFT_35395 [Dictyostelium purpureum]